MTLVLTQNDLSRCFDSQKPESLGFNGNLPFREGFALRIVFIGKISGY